MAWGVAGWPYCRSVAFPSPARGRGGQQVAGRESERRRGEPSSTRVSSELTRVSSELLTVTNFVRELLVNIASEYKISARKDIDDNIIITSVKKQSPFR